MSTCIFVGFFFLQTHLGHAMSKQMISREDNTSVGFFFVGKKESNNTLSLNSVGTVKRSAG